ncbi:hypothetical protein FRC09_013098, partial [Ceratobasidium sp. 395]
MQKLNEAPSARYYGTSQQSLDLVRSTPLAPILETHHPPRWHQVSSTSDDHRTMIGLPSTYRAGQQRAQPQPEEEVHGSWAP